jgi:hypothetical protein
MNGLKRKLAVRATLLLLATAALGGCVVEPYPYWHPHRYYYW